MTDARAIGAARRLACREGILAGFSSGACLAGAVHLLAEHHAGATIAIVLADSGMNYLSTDLCPTPDATPVENS